MFPTSRLPYFWFGETPLMFAILGEYQAVVKYLISKDADPNKANNKGITPLHILADRGNCPMADFLLSKGAMVDPLCRDYEAPLHVAARKSNAEIVKLLLKHNADYNRFSKRLHTPLMESVFGNSLECLEILIEAGADVNVGSHVTPLTVAAGKGLDDCIKCLLRHGANPNDPDENGKMPIEIAASKGWTQCVEILLPVTETLAKYAGMNIDGIVEVEKAVTDGDAAYMQGDYALALECYTQALNLGHPDAALYAKTSLCHLFLHNRESAFEDADAYSMRTGLPFVSADNAIRLVLEYGKKFKEQWANSRY